MNQDPMYQPAWAKDALTKADPQELQMLRHFYQRWEEFHKIPNDKAHRQEHEMAAMLLVDAATALRQLNAKVILHG